MFVLKGLIKLLEVIPGLMKNAGIPGYLTSHSLCVTAAARLYNARVDEDTIIQRTGHRSSQGAETEKLKLLSSIVLNQVEDHK